MPRILGTIQPAASPRSTNAAEYSMKLAAQEQLARTTNVTGARSQNMPGIVSNVQTPPFGTSALGVSASGIPSGTSSESTASGSKSIYDILREQIEGRQFNRPGDLPAFEAPGRGMSASQRAAMMVNGKYSGQQAAFNRQAQKNDENLNIGTATQRNYGQIGDAKLAEVYGNLTKI